MEEEMLELKIKRLETTCNSLRHCLKSTSMQLSLLELMIANGKIEDINYLIADTAETLHQLHNLYNFIGEPTK